MNSLISERKVVVELAGWLPTPEIEEALGGVADCDYDIAVRRAAISALVLHSREAIICTLFTEFPSATPKKRWSLLLAILSTADSYLLTEYEDPLWLGTILSDDVPAAYAHHAESVLRQRKQKEN